MILLEITSSERSLLVDHTLHGPTSKKNQILVKLDKVLATENWES